MAVVVDEHVCRFDIQVQHAVFVRVSKRLAQGVRDVRFLVVGERVTVDLCEELLERKSVHVFHDQVGKGGIVGEVDDRNDIGVLQHACGARLGKRRGGGARRCGHAFCDKGDALDGDASLQARVEADLDAAKTAGCARLERAITTQEGCGAILLRGMLREQRHGVT